MRGDANPDGGRLALSKDESREWTARGFQAISWSSSSFRAVVEMFVGENLNVSEWWSGSDCCGTRGW